jgi:uncharacterized membrane protein YeaQ/YmgE (transglycosylase-associated protein family)
MELLIGWIFFSVIAGVIASRRGRSGFGFFLLGLVFTPLIGIVAAIAVKSGERLEMDHVKRGGSSSDFRQCPFCAEIVQRAAVKCRHCGSELPPLPPMKESFAKRVNRVLNA